MNIPSLSQITETSR